MAKFLGSKGHTGLATVAWLLATAGFALLLAGVASMQQECGSAGANLREAMGVVNYLAPVPCDRFFSFDWFITFFHFFVWLLVAAFLFSSRVHVARPMLTSLLAIASVLLMFMTNTWYRTWSGLGPVGSNTFSDRAKVTFAGALIAAVADLLLLMILGMHDEKEVVQEDRGPTYTSKEAPRTGTTETIGVHAGQPGERYETIPATGTQPTTTTTAAGEHPAGTTGAAMV